MARCVYFNKQSTTAVLKSLLLQHAVG